MKKVRKLNLAELIILLKHFSYQFEERNLKKATMKKKLKMRLWGLPEGRERGEDWMKFSLSSRNKRVCLGIVHPS